MEAAAQQQAEKPQENLGFFRYARNFIKGLLKDSKFWSRFNAIPNGVIFIAQGVAGAIFLVAAAPVIAQVPGIAACAALAGIGLYGIGYGLPRAWQSMEALCTRTFPTFNPLKKIREPVQAFARKIAQTPVARKVLKNPLARFTPKLKTEREQDMFLAALTLEGASAAGIACAVAIAPHVMALPAITIAGGALMAGAFWTIGTCAFDVYCSGKTLFQAWRERRQEKKMKTQASKPAAAAPPPVEAKAAPLANTTAGAFNKTADGTPSSRIIQLPPRPCNEPPRMAF